MATSVEKVLMALVVIAIVVSAGNMIYLMDVPGKLAGIESRLGTIETGLAQNELFTGERALYQAAKEEGGLIVYTTLDISDIVTFFQAFSKRYPGISTTYQQLEQTDHVAKVTMELAAGQKGADIHFSGTSNLVLRGMNAFMNYTTVQLDKLVIKDPITPVVTITVPVIVYNTNMLNSSDLPSGWEDLTNSKYQGKIAMFDLTKATTGDHIAFALKDYWNNNTRWTNFIAGLKGQGGMFTSSSLIMRLVVSGEYPIGFVALSHDAYREKLKGSPIDYVNTIDPIIVWGTSTAVAINAPHPNAAKLFAEWMCSTEGQLSIASVYRTPNRIGTPSEVSLESYFPTVTNIASPSNDYMLNVKSYVDQYVVPIWGATT